MFHLSRLSARLVLRTTCVALFAGAAACSNDLSPITAPPSASVHTNLVRSLLSALTAHGVKRLNRLPFDIVETINVGAEGGALRIPRTGLTLVIPAGALSQTTHLTVTAKAGEGIAYQFEPHGLVFARPLRLTQDLRGSTWNLDLLDPPALGYFPTDADYDPINVAARIVEWEPSLVSLLTRQISADIPHFSGYMVSSGRR